MHQREAVNGDVVQAVSLGKEDRFPNVDFSQLKVWIRFAEVGANRRKSVFYAAMPTVWRVMNLLNRLLFVKRLLVQIDISSMMPLAIVQPAAVEL